MPGADRVLQIVIRAKNEASKVLKDTQKDIGGMAKVGAAGAGIAAVGVAGIATFNKLGDGAANYISKVVTMQRVTGLNAAESSKATAVFNKFGIEGKAVGTVFKSLDNQMLANNKTTVNTFKVQKAAIKLKELEAKYAAAHTEKEKAALKPKLDLARVTLQEAEAGKKSASAFATMGIQTQDANGKSREQVAVLRDVAGWYSKQTDKALANATVAKVLGKNWQAFLPVLQGGTAAWDKNTAAAAKNGLVLGQDALDSGKKYGALMKDNAQAVQGMTVQVGLLVLPFKILIEQYINKFLNWLNSTNPATRKLVVTIAMVGSVLAVLVGGFMMVMAVLPMVAGGLGMVGGAFSLEAIAAAAAWIATLGPIALIIAAIALVAAGVYLVIRNWDKIKAFFTKVWGAVERSIKAFWGKAKAFIAKWWPEMLLVAAPFIAWPIYLMKRWNVIGPLLKKFWASVKLRFREGVDGALSFFRNLPTVIAQILLKVFNFMTGPIRKIVGLLSHLNPFKRHSPSLVDNVLSGVNTIASAYSSIGNIRVKTPTLGGLGGPTLAAVGAVGGGTSGLRQPPQELHVYLDGRELNRGLAKNARQSTRSGAR